MCEHPPMDAQHTAAQQLLERFLSPDEDHEALFQSLKPPPELYAQLFTDAQLADKLREAAEALWAAPCPIRPAEAAQTELLVYAATSEELEAQEGPAMDFPGGYRNVGPKLAPGLRLFAFKFVEPGHHMGTLFDGLHPHGEGWAFIPKPWLQL